MNPHLTSPHPRLPGRIDQPGPAPAERILAVEARGRAFEMVLPAGLPLLEAVRRGFTAEGFASGVVRFGRLALAPFAYVMPALSETPEHAAFYSAVYRPGGVSWLESGAMTFGTRDGAPFFHAHALWREADGKRSGGHILPEDGTVVAEEARVSAFGLDGAGFEGRVDPETNFKLFEPVARPSAGARTETRAFAMRLRPNQDFAGCLEEFCAVHAIKRATLRGGVGSTIGARFDHGVVIENFATEIYLREAHIAPDAAGKPVATLDIGLVDYTGQMAEGRLKRGANPVLMTMELVLVAD
jgi:predicted DNA-binding protein with PD1-like motif